MANESLSLEFDSVFDVEGTLSRYGESTELLLDMINFFLQDSPQLVEDLRIVVAHRDAQGVRGKAHALKGLLAGCGGKRAAHTAQRLENAGSSGDMTDVDLLFNALLVQVDLLRQAVVHYQEANS